MEKKLNKYLWVMFGGAIWDALWSVTEFLTPDKFWLIKDFQWRPKFRTKPWERTDDTAMTLCLAQSLIDCNWFNIEDQLDKYLQWFENWYMSSTDRAFWIWRQTWHNIYKYKMYKEWKIEEKIREKDLSGKNKDSNWSIMRIGSIPLYFFNNIKSAIYYAWESVKSTHNTDICIDTAKYFVWLIIGALLWESKETLLSINYSPIPNYRNNNINKHLKKIVDWSYKNKNKKDLWLKYWYVLDSLEVALWWFYNFDNFEEWLINIVNLWYDADTNWCIYWFLAWAYYWYDNIPDRRKDNIAKKELITKITMDLYNLKNTPFKKEKYMLNL